MEKWKDIKEYKGLYMISNYGNLKSLYTNKILKCTKDPNGYPMAVLYKNGQRKMIRVHRLVASHFIENPKNLPFINHIDEDKKNNNVVNLEWCTHQQNMHHSKARWFKFLSPEGYRTIILNLNMFCNEFNLNQGCMTSVHSGNVKSYKGWTKA